MKGKTMAYPLLGTKIVRDEEKVLREKKYNLSAKYEYLANLGLFICHYAAQNEWITKNVKEWVWIDEDEGNENMMAKLKKENIGVWK